MKPNYCFRVSGLITAILFTGCASLRTPDLLRARQQQEPPPESERARAQLGRIGVVSARFAPEAKFNVGHLESPMAPENTSTTDLTTNKTSKLVDGTIKGAAVGTVLGMLIGMAVGFAACAPAGPFAAACAVLGASFGAGGGAATSGIVGGAATAYAEKTESLPTPTETTENPGGATAAKLPTGEELEASVKKVLSALQLQELVRDNVLQVAQAQTSRSFVLVNAQGPTVLGEKVSYGSLSNEEIDTILELTVETLGWTDRKSNSVFEPVSFFITVRARLVRVSDDEVLYDDVYRYDGIKRSLNDWDEQVLHIVINYAGEWLAERIVAHVVARAS